MAATGDYALWAWLAPGVSFLLLSLVVPLRRSGRPAAWLSIVLSAGALAGAVLAWRATVPDMARRILWEWIPVEDGVLTSVGVLADADSTLMLILVALVSFLVQVYSLGYLADEPPPSLGRYYAYQSLFAFSMMGLVLAPNFVQLFICWELVGLCSYLLIGYWYQRPEAARAQAYDCVFNGNELGGGSIRISDPRLQAKIFALLGIDEETANARFGFLLEGLRAGAPPHGGIAFGFDRISMQLANAGSLRDVIAFPKTTAARALFEGAPAPVPSNELTDLHITVNGSAS